MTYPNIIPATFLARPNRFVAEVELGGEPLRCHVKNTGRCRELLLPGTPVWLTKSENPQRKTAYDLVTVQKGARLVNLDSQAPNACFREWAGAGHFVPGLSLLKGEQTFGHSRFDFYWEAGERRGFVEVKGVTLERDGAVYFPDAPTQRGVRHVEELIACRETGFEAAVFFVVQLEGATHFSPNQETHPAFGAVLRLAQQAGVDIYAMDCRVRPDALEIRQRVPILL